MPRKPKLKPDNPEQFKRFLETAREVEVDESLDAVDRAFKKVVKSQTPTSRKLSKRSISQGKLRRS